MTTAVQSPPNKRLVKRILSIAILLAVLGALAWPKLKASEEAQGPAPAGPQGGDPLPVRAYVIQPGTLADRIYTTGSIRANEAVNLVSEASGKLTDILFQEGTYVDQGQLLVKINDAELQAQLDRAEYRLKLAEEREVRQRQILEKGGISQEAYDAVLNEVNVLRAEIQLVQAQIAQTEIRAPFSGLVGLRYVSEGSFISPQTQIATLQSVNPIKLDFSVPEQYAGLIQPGKTVLFRVQGSPQVYRGQVYAIEPRIDRSTLTLQIRATAPNPDGQLLPGAFAEVELILEEVDSALTVPAISVIPELGGKKVYILENGVVAQRQVETGIRTDSTVQVLTGLAAGDTVLTTGLQQVRPGMPVQLTINNEQ